MTNDAMQSEMQQELQNRIAEFTNGNLEFLDLSRLRLKEFPVEIFALESVVESVTEIFLNDNELTSLPAEIAKLKKLTKLDLSFNKLTSLPIEIAQLQNLETLGLMENELTSLWKMNSLHYCLK